MAGQNEPWLRRAGPIRDEQADMLRRVSGRVKNLDRHIAKREHVAVSNAVKRRLGVRARKKHILRPGRFGEPPAGRGVIGMNMGVDDVENLHSRILRSLQIGLDFTDRIDHGRRSLAAAPEQIGCADRVRVQELLEEHEKHQFR